LEEPWKNAKYLLQYSKIVYLRENMIKDDLFWSSKLRRSS
jgi:hypothetical protein